MNLSGFLRNTDLDPKIRITMKFRITQSSTERSNFAYNSILNFEILMTDDVHYFQSVN